MKHPFFVILYIFLFIQTSCEKDDIDAKFIISLYGKVSDIKTGQPISGVIISDGYTTSVTDENGLYSFKGHTDARHVFYSVPEAYEIPLIDGIPDFYETINTAFDSIETNFELTPLKNGIENEFTLFCVADPQVWDTRTINRLKNETINDLKNEAQQHNLVYGITLGDLVGDKPELMKDLKQAFVSTEIPFFHTIGNHDFNEEISNPLQSIKNYETHFGPVDYSFNRGKAHVVVMNNILYKGNRKYNLGFTREQIEWLKSNLQHVPKEKMLIVCVHIPVKDDPNVQHRNEFLNALNPFKEVHIMSGHYHLNRNFLHNEHNIYEHITGTASGLWWSGTVNKCGTPNGYAVYEVKGNTIKNWYYKSINYAKEHQIHMYAPYTFGDTKGYVVANVWNADKNWKIELIENGSNRGEMERFKDYAPGTYAFLKAAGLPEPGNKNASSRYAETNHLYRLKPLNNNAEITVKATDRFGNTYFQKKFVESIDELKKYR
ncbi:Calcineurin-like phosphoesterase [Tangfeifania diversioriginum]|uniref:Calcineurin-like phosphoesterase n=1 Tax=Tangfeifania diversioriginum TaxID=1168035 RepID=A0A1M6MI81_9BACT|nr:calcineurin-like phosphoesterase family protein [Tangfeifania diversioriginum]SHJ83221.1 Calcineurin-like phosphoesterase [Tangfeifania diversioriginum]